MAYCPHCGTANKPNSKFCKNCGAVLSAPHEIRCAICGTFNRAGDGFCSHCGARLGATRPMAVETADTLAPFKPLPQSPATKPQVSEAEKNNATASLNPGAKNQSPLTVPPSTLLLQADSTTPTPSLATAQEAPVVAPVADSPSLPPSNRPAANDESLPEWVRVVHPFETEESTALPTADSQPIEGSRPAASAGLTSTNTSLQPASATPVDSPNATTQEIKSLKQEEAPAHSEELPEWLKRMQGLQASTPGEKIEPSAAPLSNPPVDDSDDEGLPEWLRQLEAMHPEAAEAGKRRTWLERVRGSRPKNGDSRPSSNG